MNYLISETAKDSALWGALAAEELFRLGVRLVCIAPGSRSTPLVTACARHKGLVKVVCQDERSAGFYALGYAKATQTPAVVIVTSGSAVANLFPSVVEASNDSVPLILLTADRPWELRDVGANQTIDQVKIFSGYVRWFNDVPVPDTKASPRALLSMLDFAYYKAIYENPGPVHLNFMLREPLVCDDIDPLGKANFSEIESWRVSANPLCEYDTSKKAPSIETIDKLEEIIKKAKTGLIVVGALRCRDSQQAILELARRINWPILPDILSGLRMSAFEQVANYADLSLLYDDTLSMKEEAILQIGGRLVSKRLQTYLEKSHAVAHIMIDEFAGRVDPGNTCTHRVNASVKAVVSALVDRFETDSRAITKCHWLERSLQVGEVLATDEQLRVLNEMIVARSLTQTLDDRHVLFISSSMPIRDVNMFACSSLGAPQIFANRGASGIDGIVSSACGVFKGASMPGVLFCGDLTFLHDSGGLSLVKSLDKPMAIVVVNNNGGGIFSMLEIDKQKDVLSPYFDAEHEVNLSAICLAHDVRHVLVDSFAKWAKVLNELSDLSEHTVIEVVSDKEENRQRHQAIFGKIRESLSLHAS